MKTHLSPIIWLCITLMTPLILTDNQLLASDKITINIVTENAGPLNYEDKESKQVKGFAVELIKVIMEDAKLDYTINILPWVRAYREANTRENTLIFSMGRTAEREEMFKWIGQIVPMEYALYGLSKNQSKKTLSLEEIKNKTIGVTRNDLRHQYLANNNFNNLIFTRSYEHTQKLLLHGRIDYFIASIWEISNFKKTHNLIHTDVFSVLDLKALKTGLYYAFSKQTNDEVVSKVKNSFQKIVDNGTFYNIMKPILIELKEAKQSH